MADDSPAPAQAPPLAANVHDTPQHEDTISRQELVSRARSFLTSPQVSHEDVFAKRRFLVDKGLTEPEINGLLSELPPPLPVVPPRTYPQPPPSNLPNLLVGVARILTWAAGGTAAFLAIYFRFILPRLTQTYQARHALQTHQRGLLDRLQMSLSSLKDAQASSFALLPKPDRFKENARFAACNVLDELLAVGQSEDETHHIPEVSLLRCAILDSVANAKRGPTTEELFDALQAKIPSLTQGDNQAPVNTLWETLNTAPIFHHETPDDGPAVWSYVPAPVPSPAPLLSSLNTLTHTLPSSTDSPSRLSRHQHTLQALGDFTGYLTTQAYSLALPAAARPMFGMDSKLTPEADEVRREIRALKGLVLNRRSFMPSPIPATSASSLIS